jgi:hypothetical protein
MKCTSTKNITKKVKTRGLNWTRNVSRGHRCLYLNPIIHVEVMDLTYTSTARLYDKIMLSSIPCSDGMILTFELETLVLHVTFNSLLIKFHSNKYSVEQELSNLVKILTVSQQSKIM